METVVDPLNSVSSKYNLEKVNNPEKFTKLLIKNHNKNIKWNHLEKFINLEILHLENCLVDSFTFFSSISKLQKLTTFKYNEECFFKKSEKKFNNKFSKLNKIVFIFSKKGNPDLSLLSLYDKQNLSNNFINSFPNYPSAYQNINEIEFVNYEDFLEKLKQEDYDYEYSDIYNGKDIFFKCDIYNLSRIKNLKNIKFCEKDNEIFEKKLIVEKLFSFPSHKSIKINNTLIKDFKDKFLKSENLYLDYTYYPYDDNLLTSIKRHSSIRDCLEVHWPSQKYNGYKNNFKELLKQEIDHIIVGPTFDFIYETYFDYEGSSVDDFGKDILKIKSLKKITFEIFNNIISREEETYDWHATDSDGYYMDVFIRLIHTTLKKNITVEIDFKDIKSSSDLGETHEEYIRLFYLFINIQSNKELKNRFIIKNLNLKECEDYFNRVVLNKFKSIVIIDDQSNSEILKKFKNIELLHDWQIDMGLEGLGLNSGLVQVDLSKLKSKKEEILKNFLWENESWPKQFWDNKHHSNPGKAKVFVKKSWLDNSAKIIFKNLETVSFYYIGKKIIYSDDSYFKDKTFFIPKSIDYKSINDLSICGSPCLSLQDLKIFPNLKHLTIENNLDENKLNFRTLPQFESLKDLNINMYYPIMRGEEKSVLQNIESSHNLENISISGIFTESDETGRWSLLDIDLSNFHSLKKLKKLSLWGISLSDLKNIKSLESLETFELTNPTVITEEMKSDDGTINPPMTEENLSFIKNMENLSELKLYLPRFHINTSNFNPKKLISLINPKVKKLEILCGFTKEKITDVHKLYNESLNFLKEIEHLNIHIGCIEAPALKYNDKIEGAYEKAEIKRNEQAKNPIIIDFSNIKKMKHLKEFEIDIDPYFGIKTSNIIEIANCKKLSKIKLKFDYRELKIDIKELRLIFDKIATKRQKFLIEINENKTYKDKDVVDGRYDLNEEDKEKYDLIEKEEERDVEINGDSLETAIFNTFKKKEKK